ncbi:hypothetical protein BDZ45DRAFT_3582 [Acephala macrosclerotiorum]|nr:hypothetical protein BDZ45DRAFT_3582 [Acephala macrosclerotiorum]
MYISMLDSRVARQIAAMFWLGQKPPAIDTPAQPDVGTVCSAYQALYAPRLDFKWIDATRVPNLTEMVCKHPGWKLHHTLSKHIDQGYLPNTSKECSHDLLVHRWWRIGHMALNRSMQVRLCPRKRRERIAILTAVESYGMCVSLGAQPYRTEYLAANGGDFYGSTHIISYEEK